MERHEKWKLSECNQCIERNVNIKSINKHKGDTENRDTKCDMWKEIYKYDLGRHERGKH